MILMEKQLVISQATQLVFQSMDQSLPLVHMVMILGGVMSASIKLI